jgi:hypothetical protein
MLDLTAKVCSYHLTLLGRHGLVEETGEGKGRARPWRLAVSDLSYVYRSDEGAEVESAADEVARTVLGRDARIVSTFIQRRHELPDEWRNVALMLNQPMSLTPAQLHDLGSDMHMVLKKYSPAASTDTRPEARSVHLAVYAVPVELSDLAR